MNVWKGIALIAVIGLSLVLSSCSSVHYFGRYMFWGFPDSKDCEKFPSIIVHNAPPAFKFRNDFQKEKDFASSFRTIEYKENNKTKKAEFDDLLQSTGTTGFVVIQDDIVLYERYFNGENRESIVTSFSISKVLISALLGIAISEGYISNVDESVTRYIPELSDRGFDAVTIRHLLTMSSGIRYNGDLYPWSDKPKIYYWPSLRELALGVTIEREPGKFFQYNDYHSLLLGMILERATRKTVAAYLEDKLWKPLGMDYPASWSVDSEENKFEKMGAGFNARTIDLAKIGRLYLHKGNWNGRQIIPDVWVKESTEIDPDISQKKDYYKYYDVSWGPFFKSEKEYYKYFWWGYSKDESCDFFAMGNLGQFIYISPAKKTIIVRVGAKWGKVEWWPDVFKALVEKL
jgi:CubicO group peptidase (beta-lactamase class C family)